MFVLVDLFLKKVLGLKVREYKEVVLNRLYVRFVWWIKNIIIESGFLGVGVGVVRVKVKVLMSLCIVLCREGEEFSL